MKIIKPFLFSLLLFLVLTPSLFAQPYLGIETNNIRIDPEWISTMQATGFSWAYEVVVDEEGNSYSTGYFQNGLTADSVYIGDDKRLSRRSDITFIAKRDSKGNLLWLNHVIARSRPTRMKLDANGNLVIIGLLMSENAVFLGTDSSSMDLKWGGKSGVFICRYSPEGKILKASFVSEEDEYPNDFTFDSKGNIYIVGAQHYRRAYRPSLQQRKLLVTKLNSDWEVEWRSLGDTIGQSNAMGVTVVGKRIFVAGTYSDTTSFGKVRLRSKYRDQQPLLIQLNRKGKFLQATDSIGKAANYVISAIGSDSKGNIYTLAGSSYSYAALSKFDKKGKLVWSQEIRGRGTVYSNRLLIDRKDNIYICGESYGAIFGSNGPFNYTYKTKGGTDPYIASYSSKGELRWLKVYGGQGTDYCKSIAVNDKHLYSFGWTNRPFPFFRKETKGRGGYLFYEAKFNLSELEKTEGGAQKTTGIVEEKWPKISSLDCSCEEKEKKKPGYAPGVSGLLEYDEFVSITGWRMLPKPLSTAPYDSSYKYLFFTGFQNSFSHSSVFNGLNLTSFRPIYLLHPDSSFILELNPCNNPSKRRETGIYVNYNYPIRNYQPGFDIEDFDSTSMSYLDIAFTAYSVSDKKIISSILFNNPWFEYEEVRSIFKDKYAIEWEGQENEEEIVKSISNQITAKNLDIEKILNDQFISTDLVNKHVITETEKQKMNELMYGIHSQFSFEQLDNLIHPSFSARASKTMMGVYTDPAILHTWNPIKNKPKLGEDGKLLPAYILVDVAEAEMSTEEGIEIKSNSICFRQSEIGNTGVLLDVDKFAVIGPKSNYRLSQRVYNYPLLNPVDLTKIQARGMHGFNIPISPELQNFTGIYFPKAKCAAKLFKNKAVISGKEIALNNHLITGFFELDIKDEFPLDTAAREFTISLGDKTKKVSLKEVEEEFKELGFTDVRADLNEFKKQIVVYFIYRKPE